MPSSRSPGSFFFLLLGRTNHATLVFLVNKWCVCRGSTEKELCWWVFSPLTFMTFLLLASFLLPSFLPSFSLTFPLLSFNLSLFSLFSLLFFPEELPFGFLQRSFRLVPFGQNGPSSCFLLGRLPASRPGSCRLPDERPHRPPSPEERQHSPCVPLVTRKRLATPHLPLVTRRRLAP